MKASTILRRAAELSLRYRRSIGGCFAIYTICKTNKNPFKYFELFEPETECGMRIPRERDYWFGRPEYCTDEQHEHRIMSLLMAAAIAESEGN